MSSYRQMRNKDLNIKKKPRRDDFSNKIASYSSSLKDFWMTINQLLNKRSKATNIDILKVDDDNIKGPS